MKLQTFEPGQTLPVSLFGFEFNSSEQALSSSGLADQVAYVQHPNFLNMLVVGQEFGHPSRNLTLGT